MNTTGLEIKNIDSGKCLDVWEVSASNLASGVDNKKKVG